METQFTLQELSELASLLHFAQTNNELLQKLNFNWKSFEDEHKRLEHMWNRVLSEECKLMLKEGISDVTQINHAA